MSQLRNITPDFLSDNVGGLEIAFFIPEEDIKTWPAADGLVMHGDIELHEGKTWFLMVYSRYTSRYEHRLKHDRNNGLYELEQQGVIPKDTPALGNQLLFMKGRRYVLLFRDRNGYLRVTPPGYSLSFSNRFSTGDEPSNRNGYQVAFDGEAPYPAFYYSGGFVVSELGLVQPPYGGNGNAQPVIVRFNGEYVKTVYPGEILDVESDFTMDFKISFV